MKKTFTLLMLLVPLFLVAQITPTHPDYDKMKLDGLLPQPEQKELKQSEVPPSSVYTKTEGSGFFIPLDDSFILSMSPNDDGSCGPVDLGFTFCLYGTEYNQVYINNNGNLSFGESYSTFSPVGFPSDNFVMVAPFWADVDTRGIGTVKHKLEAGRLTIIFDNVGYYNSQTDKTNTFQVIITDGNDPLIGVGNNVAFAYEEMEWTTGSASSGVNGFGGYPATVGVNKGDGENYALIGRFDQPGTCYDGPFGGVDCVSFLNYKRFTFDACAEEVIIVPNDPEIPLSDWAIYIGVFLIFTFFIIRFRRLI